MPSTPTGAAGAPARRRAPPAATGESAHSIEPGERGLDPARVARRAPPDEPRELSGRVLGRSRGRLAKAGRGVGGSRQAILEHAPALDPQVGHAPRAAGVGAEDAGADRGLVDGPASSLPRAARGEQPAHRRQRRDERGVERERVAIPRRARPRRRRARSRAGAPPREAAAPRAPAPPASPRRDRDRSPPPPRSAAASNGGGTVGAVTVTGPDPNDPSADSSRSVVISIGRSSSSAGPGDMRDWSGVPGSTYLPPIALRAKQEEKSSEAR